MRLSLAKVLCQAIEAGDEAAEMDALENIGLLHGLPLHSDLQEIAAEFRAAMCNDQVSRELSRLVQRELPDAHLRLHQVVELTEAAAHQTLGAVEQAMPVADRIGDAARALRDAAQARRGSAPEDRAAAQQVLRVVEEDVAALKRQLADVMMAQGFQDITGQIIRRVGELVARLEAALSKGAKREPEGAPDSVDLRRGTGPAVPGRTDVVSGQQDVDDLLSELGV